MPLREYKQLKKSKLDLLNRTHERGLEIYISLFLKNKTQLELSNDLFPVKHNKKEKKKRIRINTVIIRYVRAFNSLNWLKSKRVHKDSTGNDPIRYESTLKPYFLSLKNKGLTERQKRLIEREVERYKGYIFRKGVNGHGFIEDINIFMKRKIYINLLKKFSEADKIQARDKDFESLIELIPIFYDDLGRDIIFDNFTKNLPESFKLGSNSQSKYVGDWLDKIPVKIYDSEKAMIGISSIELV